MRIIISLEKTGLDFLHDGLELAGFTGLEKKGMRALLKVALAYIVLWITGENDYFHLRRRVRLQPIKNLCGMERRNYGIDDEQVRQRMQGAIREGPGAAHVLQCLRSIAELTNHFQ